MNYDNISDGTKPPCKQCGIYHTFDHDCTGFSLSIPAYDASANLYQQPSDSGVLMVDTPITVGALTCDRCGEYDSLGHACIGLQVTIPAYDTSVNLYQQPSDSGVPTMNTPITVGALTCDRCGEYDSLGHTCTGFSLSIPASDTPVNLYEQPSNSVVVTMGDRVVFGDTKCDRCGEYHSLGHACLGLQITIPAYDASANLYQQPSDSGVLMVDTPITVGALTCDRCGEYDSLGHVCVSRSLLFNDVAALVIAEPEIVEPVGDLLLELSEVSRAFVEQLGSNAKNNLLGFLERCVDPGSDGVLQAAGSYRSFLYTALRKVAPDESLIRAGIVDLQSGLGLRDNGEIKHRSRYSYIERFCQNSVLRSKLDRPK